MLGGERRGGGGVVGPEKNFQLVVMTDEFELLCFWKG